MNWLRFALPGLAVACSVCAAAAQRVSPTQPYVVQRGDTLIGIRDRLLAPGTDWRVLQRVNRVADPLRLAPGRTLMLPSALLREQPVVAEVLHVFGDAQVTRVGAPPERLLAGSTLAAGDRVRTGIQASATLRFADGSRVLIRPESELRIEHLTRSSDGQRSRTELHLERGAADSSVTPAGPSGARRYEIRNPVANLGVRGTAFRTQIGNGRLQLEVLEGRVGAEQGGGAAIVEAGFGALAGGAPLEVRPLLHTTDLASVPPRIERLPLAFRWGALDGAAAYRAQVLQQDQVDALVADARVALPAAIIVDDLPDGRYALRVRGIDAAGLEGRDAAAIFVLKARPEPPFLQRPAAAATLYDEAVDFAWTRQREAAHYRLQVADTPDFAAPRIDRADIAGTEIRLALPLGTHHWRVASVRAGGDQGPFGDAQTLLRRAPPPAPSPAESMLTDAGLALRWRTADEPGTSFVWQLAADNGFDRPLREGKTATPELLLAELSAGTYQLRVRAVNAAGVAGPWGTAQEIEVPRSRWWWMLVMPLLWLL